MFPLVFGTVFVVTGLVPLWLAMRTFAKDRAIARWPRAPGRMTHASLESYTSRSRDEDGWERTTTMYEPVVRYTYTVDGRELEGDRLARVKMASNPPPVLTPYTPGSHVLVYYDPDDPTIAYLEVHRSIGAVILCILGGVFVFIGLLVPALVLFA